MAINHKPPFWRRRSYQIAAAVVAALILAGLGANFYLAQTYQPAGAVSDYLAALQGKNAQAAWNVAEVQAPHGQIDAALLDLSALQHAVAQGTPDINRFDVTSTRYLNQDQTSAVVSVTYETSSGSRQTTFTVVRGPERHFGIYPSWRVLIEPAIIDLTPPSSSADAIIDGKQLRLSSQSAKVAVWPLVHGVLFPATAMLEAQVVRVDLFDKAAVAVAAKPTLTDAGQVAVIAAIKSAFAQCAARTSSQSDGCPQRFNDAFVDSGAWRLVGDPTQDVAIAFTQEGLLTATGHYAMVFAYQESNGTMHTAVAGGFVAGLKLSASGVTVASLGSSTDAQAIQRPDAATDDVIKSVVSKAMTACAAIASADPPDCPQQFFFPDATILGWKMSGDPLAGASVAFDPSTGLFTVQGTFTMAVSYELTSSPETRPSSTTSYDATLVWDGSGPQLVTISGGYQ